jgi:AcrR family transcriptional regulator
MLSSEVGRPREHNERTASALLEAAERTIEEHGIGALSLRELASDAGTTTRAVYTLFGSKEGLLGALGAWAFELLEEGLEALPVTDDPGVDLTDAALMFRRFALEHPALFSIGIQRTDPEAWPHFRSAASSALAVLHERIELLAAAGRIGERSVGEAALQFHALCEGLAAVELRGTPLTPTPERFWRDAFGVLIAGFATPAPHRRPHTADPGRE